MYILIWLLSLESVVLFAFGMHILTEIFYRGMKIIDEVFVRLMKKVISKNILIDSLAQLLLSCITYKVRLNDS